MKMSTAAARAITGPLSFPTKMPGTGYSLPALACITGAKLAKIAGTACSTCYALKDRWTWPNPQKSMGRRLAAIVHPLWVDAMVRLLRKTHSTPTFRIDLGVTGQRLARKGGSRYRMNVSGWHRWHESGDLQSVDHFTRICEIARQTPAIKHWLPTQELGMVRAYQGMLPENIVVRVSSVMVDDVTRRAWPHTSSVFTAAPPAGAHVCPASTQENRCMDCRACWNKDVAHVAYPAH